MKKIFVFCFCSIINKYNATFAAPKQLLHNFLAFFHLLKCYFMKNAAKWGWWYEMNSSRWFITNISEIKDSLIKKTKIIGWKSIFFFIELFKQIPITYWFWVSKLLIDVLGMCGRKCLWMCVFIIAVTLLATRIVTDRELNTELQHDFEFCLISSSVKNRYVKWFGVQFRLVVLSWRLGNWNHRRYYLTVIRWMIFQLNNQGKWTLCNQQWNISSILSQPEEMKRKLMRNAITWTNSNKRFNYRKKYNFN